MIIGDENKGTRGAERGLRKGHRIGLYEEFQKN